MNRLCSDGFPVSPVVQKMRARVHNYLEGVQRRSRAVPLLLDRRIGLIAFVWLAAIGLASIPRMLFAVSPVHNFADAVPIVVPYLLIALAPVAGYRLARASFPIGGVIAQPSIRLSPFGRWQGLSARAARSSPVFGPAGFMASMLIGLLLNVVVRSFEFLVAMPAMNGHAPQWGQTMFLLMAADVVTMSFFYMVCFVMAMRTVPLFPRMLLFVWLLDVVAQLIIARQVGAMAGLPPEVGATLRELLTGNVTKVLISAFVWLPYLILSERVNITYRLRKAR
jgi:hypothetical protein